MGSALQHQVGVGRRPDVLLDGHARCPGQEGLVMVLQLRDGLVSGNAILTELSGEPSVSDGSLAPETELSLVAVDDWVEACCWVVDTLVSVSRLRLFARRL